MANDVATQRRFGVLGVLFAMALALAVALMTVSPASAHLCVMPDEGPGNSNTSELIGPYAAEPPVQPEEFLDRGESMSNPAGKQAAWEAHFNSPVVDGPQSCEEILEGQ
jgi:hypothetical protein